MISFTLLWTNFLRLTTLLWTNIRTQKCTNTKKTRKKDEENTKDIRNFAYFSSKQWTESSGENSPLIYENISGLNWTTETKGSK